jgi:DNA-binding response OmpR family regulator
MKILIAEDNPVTRALIAKTLQKSGHEVVAVSDGKQAWETLNQSEISFVVTDWMMPGMDGLELCKRIREAGFARYVYIMLLTAKDGKSDLVEGMEAGADDFLVKPFHKDER